MNGADIENFENVTIKDDEHTEDTPAVQNEEQPNENAEHAEPAQPEAEPAETAGEDQTNAAQNSGGDAEPEPEPQAEPEAEAEEQEEEADLPVTLYIKAGVDSKVADCPVCQRLFMIIILKKIRYTVCTVNKDILPTEYKQILGNTPPPVLVDPNVQTDNPLGKVIDDVIKAEHYLEMVFSPKLENKNPPAKQIGSDIFRKFQAVMKNQDRSKKTNLIGRLRNELKKLEDFLKDTDEDDELCPGPYLEGENFTLADCDLLPKLHRIDVACKTFKMPEVMEGLDAIQKYLDTWRSSWVYNIIKYEDREVYNTYHKIVLKP